MVCTKRLYYVSHLASSVRSPCYHTQLLYSAQRGRGGGVVVGEGREGGMIKACSMGGCIPPRNVLHLLLVTSDTISNSPKGEGGWGVGFKRVRGRGSFQPFTWERIWGQGTKFLFSLS